MESITLASPGAIAFHIGPLTVRWYGVFIGLGFLVATWAASHLCKRRSLDSDVFLNGALASFIGGIIGARLYFVALNLPTYTAHPEDIMAIWQGGLSIHGGIAGGIMVAWIYAKITKFPFLPGCDIAGCALPLAQAIGRWGNFFNSEAFGRPVDTTFPIRLFVSPEHRPLQYSGESYFHPTFLYESIWDLILFGLLYGVLFNRLKRFPGMVFILYLFGYSIGRALIEPLRTDSIMVGGFAAPSVVSNILIVLSGIGILGTWIYYRSHPIAEAQNNEPQQQVPTESSDQHD